MPSTILSLRIKLANASVRASLGKYLAEYGSKRSSINLSRARASSVSRRIWSGSLGSGEVATPAQKLSTSERLCQLGNSTLSLKSRHFAAGNARLLAERAWRSAVELGSKGVAPGVARALRFWLIVSSTADRDIRRKSRGGLG